MSQTDFSPKIVGEIVNQVAEIRKREGGDPMAVLHYVVLGMTIGPRRMIRPREAAIWEDLALDQLSSDACNRVAQLALPRILPYGETPSTRDRQSKS